MTVAFYTDESCACCDDLIFLCVDDADHLGPILRVGDLEYLCGPPCLASHLADARDNALEVLVIGAAVLDRAPDADEIDQAALDSITETIFHAAAQLQSDAQCRVFVEEKAS